jgi:GNAT superfamily N-acetyltransferase
MGSIKIITTDDEIIETYDLMIQLHEEIEEKFDRAAYVQQVNTLQAEVGYQLAVRAECDRIVCVAGFRVCRNLGWGKYLYVDDLVTDKLSRSKGAGKEMLRWLIEWARGEQCVEVRLDAKVERHDAHRFYLRERMDIVAFHFRLTL